MKKLLLFTLLFLTSACSSFSMNQAATSTPESTPAPTETPPPTPIPATNIPEPTPTLEPSPTPLPRFFTTQFDSTLAGWVILQAGNETIPNVTATDGKLTMQMDSPYTWLYALYAPQTYTDIYIETSFSNNASTPTSIGLVCRYTEENGWFEYNVSTDGTYNVLIGKWLATGIADYTPVTDGSLSETITTGQAQKIGFTCLGSTLQLYFNDTLIRNMDVSQYGLSEGQAGLAASSFENAPVSVVFDSVSINEP